MHSTTAAQHFEHYATLVALAVTALFLLSAVLGVAVGAMLRDRRRTVGHDPLAVAPPRVRSRPPGQATDRQVPAGCR